MDAKWRGCVNEFWSCKSSSFYSEHSRCVRSFKLFCDFEKHNLRELKGKGTKWILLSEWLFIIWSFSTKNQFFIGTYICKRPARLHTLARRRRPSLVKGQVSGVYCVIYIYCFLHRDPLYVQNIYVSEYLRGLVHSSLLIQLKIDFNSFRNHAKLPRSSHLVASQVY